ncbi:MAG: HPr family phosphocarrier protein [Thermoactinomyces sp.]
MAEKKVTISNPSGLHARPAALLVKEAGKFKSTVKLVKNEKEVDAKSLLGVMSLAAKQNDEIIVRAEGEDAEEAVSHLTAFIEQLKA